MGKERCSPVPPFLLDLPPLFQVEQLGRPEDTVAGMVTRFVLPQLEKFLVREKRQFESSDALAFLQPSSYSSI